jgi:hypothetical protein
MHIADKNGTCRNLNTKVDVGLPPASEVDARRIELKPCATIRQAALKAQAIRPPGFRALQLLAEGHTGLVGQGDVEASPQTDAVLGPKKQHSGSIGNALEVGGRDDSEDPALDLVGCGRRLQCAG